MSLSHLPSSTSVPSVATSTARSLDELVAIASDLVVASETWLPLVRHDPSRRFYQRIAVEEAYDAWIVGWSSGHGVAAHDHGGSAGVVAVTEGRLLETRFDETGRPASSFVSAPDLTVISTDTVHALSNVDDAPATSVHVYSPPLRSMGFVAESERVRVEPAGLWRESSHATTVDALLYDARRRLARLEPHQAHRALLDGALLVDTRPAATRRAEGAIPGAVVIERNVLEWRLDPASPSRLAGWEGDRRVVLFCNEGYASSLAAASLHDLGLTSATDIVGGFRAWRLAGLPVVRAVDA